MEYPKKVGRWTREVQPGVFETYLSHGHYVKDGRRKRAAKKVRTRSTEAWRDVEDHWTILFDEGRWLELFGVAADTPDGGTLRTTAELWYRRTYGDGETGPEGAKINSNKTRIAAFISCIRESDRLMKRYTDDPLVEDLTPAMLLDVRQEALTTTGSTDRTRSRPYWRRVMTDVRALIRWAVAHRKVKTDPLKRITQAETDTLFSKRANSKRKSRGKSLEVEIAAGGGDAHGAISRTSVMSMYEYGQVIETVAKMRMDEVWSSRRMFLNATIISTAGCLRPGECVAILPGAITWYPEEERASLYVVAAVKQAKEDERGLEGVFERGGKLWVLGDLKGTAAERTVEMSGPAFHALKDQMAIWRRHRTGNFLFFRTRDPGDCDIGRPYTTDREWSRPIQSAMRRVTGKTFAPYDLRRTGASIMVASGVPMARVALYLGHTSEEMVRRVYRRFIPDAHQSVQAQVWKNMGL
jgi:integrase